MHVNRKERRRGVTAAGWMLAAGLCFCAVAQAQQAVDLGSVPINTGFKPPSQVTIGIPIRGGEDCGTGLVHDDGTFENGGSGNPATVTDVQINHRITPTLYPATLTTVCLAFTQNSGNTTLNFDIEIYDDDGPNGEPGTLLATVPAQITAAPSYPDYRFYQFDVTAEGLNIADGSVFIGGRWNPVAPQNGIYLMFDETPATPVNPGYFQANQGGWEPMGVDPLFPNYRALSVRAIEAPAGKILVVRDGQAVILDQCFSNPGQANGTIEPGERVTISVPVQALNGTFTNVVASLDLPAPAGITYVSSSSELGDLDDGDTAVAHFSVRVDAGFICLNDVELGITVSSDTGGATGEVGFGVGAPGSPTPSNMPLPIPDNSPAGINSVMDVQHSFILSDLDVRVQIDHTWIGDLIITLTGPDNTSVRLLDRPGVPAMGTVGCNNNNVHVTFSDGEADPEGVCDPSGTNAPWPPTTAGPVEPLSAFNGKSVQGTWTLNVSDNAGLDLGTIIDWELIPTPSFEKVCSVCDDSDVIFAHGFED